MHSAYNLSYLMKSRDAPAFPSCLGTLQIELDCGFGISVHVQKQAAMSKSGSSLSEQISLLNIPVLPTVTTVVTVADTEDIYS